jgi:hypothetical protein
VAYKNVLNIFILTEEKGMMKRKKESPVRMARSILAMALALILGPWASAWGQQIDLLPFFCPGCVGEGGEQRNLVGGECFYTYPSTVKGRSGFYIVKSCGDMSIYEEFAYDDHNIYHLADTSWATWNGSSWTPARCYDGRLAYSTYLNGAFGDQNGSCDRFNPHMGNEGNVWVPRYMSVGQQVGGLFTTIVAMAKDTCTCCKAQYTGPTVRSVKLVSMENLNLGGGLGFRDVVRIAIMEGPGEGENFWYARGLGWVGFRHLNPPDGASSLFDANHIRGVDYNGRPAQVLCGNAPPPVQPPTNCIASVPANRWKGEYFSNRTLSGLPSMVRDDGDGFLNMVWGTGSPGSGCGLPADGFSVRWTRVVNFAPGMYTFTMAVDDGGRFYIDGERKIDQWKDQAETAYQVGPLALSGDHTLQMEHYENGGLATAKLSWTRVGDLPSLGFNGATGWEDGEAQGAIDEVMYSRSVGPYPGGGEAGV